MIPPWSGPENVARTSYSRLLPILALRSSDIETSEDALNYAFSKALTRWPVEGIPDNPDAWLIRVARNRMIDGQRRDAKLAPKDAMPFAIPKDGTLAPQLSSVTEAIYGAYALDWLETSDDLRIEALFLADVLSTQLPTNAEALGLAALLGFTAAHREARISEGMFVPLDEQDPRKWNERLVRGAQALLQRASSLKKMGRFQLEAAIQAVHALRIDGHDMD